MKLEFDGNQDYQLEAIQAVIDIFEGQSLAKGGFWSVISNAGRDLQPRLECLLFTVIQKVYVRYG